MLPNVKRIFIFGAGFLVVFVVLNLLLLDFLFVSQRSSVLDLGTRVSTLSDSFKMLATRLYGSFDNGNGSVTPAATGQSALSQLVKSDLAACPVSCNAMMIGATASAGVRTTVVTTTPVGVAAQTSGTKGEFFIPLGSGSVSGGSDWTDVTTAQALFDAGHFGKISAAYFEVFMDTGAGEVSARLFDTTTPAILFSSLVSTTYTTPTYFSAPISLSSGNKNYRVQLKSTIATGTLEQARIRIVVQ